VYGLLLVAYLTVKSHLRADGGRPATDADRLTRDPVTRLQNLLDDLGGCDDGLRDVALRRCADGGGPEREFILSLLRRGGDEATLVPAVRAAGTLRLREAVPLLGTLLAHPSTDVANEAARSLGSIGDPTALDLLLARSSELDAELRHLYSGAPAAGFGGTFAGARPEDERGREDEGEEEEQEHDRASAAFAADARPLERILAPLAADGYRVLDRYTPEPLEKLDESAMIDVLLAVAAAQDEPTSTRYYAVRNLAYFRRVGLVAEVALLLASPQPALRFAAADTVAHLGGSAGAAALLEALSDDNPYVRSAAACGLAALGDDRALVPLMNLRDDPDDVVRYSAERALQQLEHRKDVGALLTRRRPTTASD